jgi:hypothetical protein
MSVAVQPGFAEFTFIGVSRNTFKARLRILQGVIDLVTAPKLPRTWLWVHGALSCGGTSDPLQEEFVKQRAHGHADLRGLFKRAIAEGDLPSGSDADALARFVQTVNFGLSVQAATGASRKELLRVTATALHAWPNGSKS